MAGLLLSLLSIDVSCLLMSPVLMPYLAKGSLVAHCQDQRPVPLQLSGDLVLQ